MNLETAQNELKTAQDKLFAIESDLASKQIEYDQAEIDYAETYAKYSDLKRKPKKVTLDRERTLKLRVELDALVRAKGIYQDKLAEAERNVALIELAQTQNYSEQETEFIEQTKSLIASSSRLRNCIVIFNDNARRFFENPTGPIDQLRSLANNPLFNEVSLEAFLLKGEIKQTENNDNVEFLDEHEVKLRYEASAIPQIGEDLLDELQWWSKALLDYSQNPAQTAKRSYMPPDRRPQSAIKSQTIVQVPRFARGGPDVDDADPRSDASFFRRRRLVQEKPATKELGRAKGVQSNV